MTKIDSKFLKASSPKNGVTIRLIKNLLTLPTNVALTLSL